MAPPSVLALLLLTATPVAQSVLVVDDDGGAGVDFTDLPAAVSAASSGDAILVKPGSYSSFTISNKSLIVTAETDQTVAVGGFLVSGIGPSDRVVLRGLTVGFTANGPPRLQASRGWIGLEDCSLAPGGPGGQSGMTVRDCDAVSLVRCFATGASSLGQGLEIDESAVHAFDCTFQGGQIFPNGAPGVTMMQGSLFVLGGLVRGGDGVDGFGSPCSFPPGNGGNGIQQLEPGAPQVILQGASVVGGLAGTGPPGCPPGTDGLPWVLTGGSVTDYGGTPHSLDVETPVRMGDQATNVLTGAPGDVVVLGIGLDPATLLFPAWSGVISVDPVLVTFLLGTVPPTGSFTVEIPIPTFPAFQFVQFVEQAAFVTPAGKITLSTPCYPLTLSPAF